MGYDFEIFLKTLLGFVLCGGFGHRNIYVGDRYGSIGEI